MNQRKITFDNYEGYCELYKSRFMTNEEINKYTVKMFKSGIIPCILFILTVVFYISDVVVILAIINFLITPPIISINLMLDDRENIKDELASKYPNIDVNISMFELENMLIDSKILSKELIDGQSIPKLDLNNYKTHIESEKIKQEKFNECKMNSLDDESNISLDKLEKVKIKTKKK